MEYHPNSLYYIIFHINMSIKTTFIGEPSFVTQSYLSKILYSIKLTILPIRMTQVLKIMLIDTKL